MKKMIVLLAVLKLLVFESCAVRTTQVGVPNADQPSQEAAVSVYLAGGLGSAGTLSAENPTMPQSAQGSSQHLVLLGDNIPLKKDNDDDKRFLQTQATIVQNFKGTSYSIPGDAEWKYKDSRILGALEDSLSERTGNSKLFQPQQGRPISHMAINDNLEIIFVDSQWYIQNWDKIRRINENAPDIKTRRSFIEELEDIIKSYPLKNIIIAMHHPVFSNGKHAGKYSFSDHMSPLPVVGSASLAVRRLGGTNPQDNGASMYRALASEIAALAKLSDRIVIVSGHEQSLQYLEGGGIHQVVSGSLSKGEATKLSKGNITALGGNLQYKGVFSSSDTGYGLLNYFKDGSAVLEFYSLNANKLLFRQKILQPLPIAEKAVKGTAFPNLPPQTAASIVSKKETDKSWYYNILWGQHYREYYSLPITAKTALLDTLYGGLTVTKEGGGHQSQSLRLVDAQGKQYAMRALKKDALKFLRFKIKGAAFDPDAYQGTAAEDIVADFFTTAHPYAQLAVSSLAHKAGVNHSNTKLYYFPAQQGFNDMNDKYGNALYYVEERPGKKNALFEGYQFTSQLKEVPIKDFYSTAEVMEKLRTNSGYEIDQRQYIRSRLFDMLMGDWDRHEDQWRWAYRETKKNAGTFAPIPRDRDAAFSRFDGVALAVIKRQLPETRFWESYKGDLSSVKWFNSEAYSLDKILLDKVNPEIWKAEAESIKNSISSSDIEMAFQNLPKEVQDSKIEGIKNSLKQRLENLPSIAQRYGDYISRLAVVYGTENNDQITVERLPGGKTKIDIAEKNTSQTYYSHTFDRSQTKEILLYGLNGDDEFTVKGSGDHKILLRMIGGYGNDQYTISEKDKTQVYEYKYESSTFDGRSPARKQLTNSYQTNTLEYRLFTQNNNIIVPAIGYATDDGFLIGLKETYTVKGFNGNPYKQIHKLTGSYFAAYNSGEISYQGTFANIYPKTNLQIEAYYTGPKFSNNFFGYGNQTVNPEDIYGRDYNRARTRQMSLKAGPTMKFMKINAIYESFEVEDTPGRYFTTDNFNENLFKNQQYIGGEAAIGYRNRDAEDFATAGLFAYILGGYKSNINDSKNHFSYLASKIGFDQKLNNPGSLVLQSTIAAKVIFGDDFNFYHAASIGGDNGLRGFRNERFSGNSYLYQSSNVKLRISKLRTGFLPVDFGIYGGFDCGRVWTDGEDSNKWHISQGGGLWFGGLSMTSIQTGYFNSSEGNIIFIGFNFKY